MRWWITVLLALSVAVAACSRALVWFGSGLAFGPVLGPLDLPFFVMLQPIGDVGWYLWLFVELTGALVIGGRVLVLAVRIQTRPDETVARIVPASKWLIGLSVCYTGAVALVVPLRTGTIAWVTVYVGGSISTLAVSVAGLLGLALRGVPATIRP